ncbi:Na+/H+ antiporter subunit D [Marinimicrobium sp. ABcell2]|uniref:Na+/H+ antiporter subunit D n=1 Tax=Marinimicrobium sp. ABcell2 TaxID=3069751 RepID=UPI0027B4037D|nr:Na+/H+ antiporter subunit D [Marinimicrobium sp. ABcell2]MDQ2077724.1 Na+/H+ antiporter subunit D [Marinimicrobium sp. ABcell2]
MSHLVLIPILIPLLAGALSLVSWRSLLLQRWIAVVATGLLLLVSIGLLQLTREEGFVVMHVGGWAAPFGITIVADLLSAIMIVMTGVIGFTIAIYSMAMTPERHERFGYYPLMHLLLAGVSGAFLTGDIFNLYVWFEVMLLASFALLTLGGERAQMEGAIKYVTLNLFSSAIFLSAIGLVYGTVGTLNMADLAYKLGQVEHSGMVNVLALMFMVAFGIKAAAFPLFFWLPASYHTPLVGISALFAGLLTKVGVYALYRFFTLIFNGDVDYTHNILLWGAGLTMVSGVLGAAAQFEFRRLLSFHIVSQIGYMILGLALFTPLAIIGGIFVIVHNIVVKTNLFLVSGLVYRLLGSYDLKKLGGVYRHRPGIALLFLVSALSLAGLPPLSGFVAKFLLIRAGLEVGAWTVTGVALLVSVITLYSMLKIWAEVFWKPVPEGVNTERLTGEKPDSQLWLLLLPIAGLAACAVLIGVNGQPIYEVLEAAAEQLLNPALYIEAVLGDQP